MPLASRRSRRSSIDIWPGFVDALAQLLMVIIFMLLVFTAGQFFLSDALSGRDKALKELQQQVSQLSDLLSLERSANADLRSSTTQLTAQLSTTTTERDALKSQVADLSAKVNQETAIANQASGQLSDANTQLGALRDRADTAEKALTAEQQVSAAARAQVEQLTASIAALRDQLAKIAAALDVSDAKVKDQQTQIADLGKRLNLALATKVQELARFRSEFFGRLREIIGDRPDIHIVGDRFVFQSEVLFSPGSADLGDAAKQQLDPVITALKEIADKIPKDINWVLRVDGHTDRRPINNAQFASNWELSAARAISVVRYAISQGVPANRLAAAGFADNQPIDSGDSDDAFRRNRRIELKLTER
ncbi:MAG TPA: peptidoglycan -binding protein [Stellaceae bacterium]|jgi:chemotaxis protein MotB|nr:peptidoglycan -binding protein [Stellaceae bacterium]